MRTKKKKNKIPPHLILWFAFMIGTIYQATSTFISEKYGLWFFLTLIPLFIIWWFFLNWSDKYIGGKC